MIILLKRLYRHFFPRAEQALLKQLRARKLEKQSFDFTLPDGQKVKGLMPLEAYHEYKDIFMEGIYAFQSDKPNPRIIDGGGYVGFSCLYYKHLYKQAKITVFECEPKALKVLKENFSINGHSDIEIVEAALSDKEGTLKFSQEGGDAGSLYLNEGPSIEVSCVTLLPWLDDEVDFLKLNIEGAEMDVIASCGEKLRSIKEMVIEFHSFANQPQRLQDLLKSLSDQGFRYIINHFDYESNYVAKPPFKLSLDTSYVLLVYAKRF